MPRKHTYWIADYIADPDDPCASAYAVRGARRKDVVAEVAEHGADDYSKPRKVTVEFVDLTDLIDSCLCEGSSWWEASDA